MDKQTGKVIIQKTVQIQYVKAYLSTHYAVILPRKLQRCHNLVIHFPNCVITEEKTRSYERTRIAYFPVTLILKEILMVWTDRQALVLKIGI